ncbi:MAG: MFS transporter [Desulfobacteraceae bacterium]|nr:MFS transporter [Desulfobacteraceae bacterium]
MENIPPKDRAYSYRWWALLGLGMALVILNLDLTIVNLALPILGQTFHVKLSILQWISNTYSLTFASLVLLAGKVADSYGHRLIYLWGISFFFLGSCIAGFASDVTVIIAGRLFQGIGMAGTFGMVFILASAAFPINQRGLAIGLLVALAGVSQAIGPTMGGMIVEHWGWRWAFLINLPFCILSFILVSWACEDKSLKQKLPIHYPSAALLIATYFALVIAFNEIENWGALSWQFLLIIAACSITFSGVMIWQTRLKDPLIDLKLFKNHIYRTVSITRPLFQFNFGAFFFILPIYLQNIAGMTPGHSGIVMLIMTASLAVSSTIIGRLNDHISPAGPIVAAHILSITGFIVMSITPIIPIHWPAFSIALICIGSNVGIMYSTTNYAAIHSLPSDKKGVGYGFFTANAYLFYSIGIGMVGYLLSTIGFSHFNHSIAMHFGENSSFLNNKDIMFYTNGALPIEQLRHIYPQQGKVLADFAIDAFSKGFHSIMWLFTAFSTLGLIGCLSFLKKNQEVSQQ